MMKRTVGILALAVVVGVTVLSPSVAMAAPVPGGSVALDHASTFSILSVFARLLGLQTAPAANAESGKSQPAQAPSSVSTSGSGNISTEGAIWGRCGGTC